MQDEGWEDPEVGIGDLRASGRLPPPKPSEETPPPPPEPAVDVDTEEPGSSRALVDGLLIGSEKAEELAARTGDQVQLITPIGRMTPAGRIPGVMAVRVAGVFDADHHDYDRWLVYASLPVAQAFLRAGDRVTASRSRSTTSSSSASQAGGSGRGRRRRAQRPHRPGLAGAEPQPVLGDGAREDRQRLVGARASPAASRHQPRRTAAPRGVPPRSASPAAAASPR